MLFEIFTYTLTILTLKVILILFCETQYKPIEANGTKICDNPIIVLFFYNIFEILNYSTSREISSFYKY